MSAFGINILTKVIFPFIFGAFYVCLGGSYLIKRENMPEGAIYVFVGFLVLVLLIKHLLFNADVSMYI